MTSLVACFRQRSQRGSLGLGEGYVTGLWGCDWLDDFFERLLRAHLEREAHSPRLAWLANSEAAWPRFAEAHGEAFHRHWRTTCPAAQARSARDLQLW